MDELRLKLRKMADGFYREKQDIEKLKDEENLQIEKLENSKKQLENELKDIEENQGKFEKDSGFFEDYEDEKNKKLEEINSVAEEIKAKKDSLTKTGKGSIKAQESYLKSKITKSKKEIVSAIDEELKFIKDNRNVDFDKEINKLKEEEAQLKGELELNNISKEDFEKLSDSDKAIARKAKEKYLVNKNRLGEISKEIESKTSDKERLTQILDGKNPADKYIEIKNFRNKVDKEYCFENLDNIYDEYCTSLPNQSYIDNQSEKFDQELEKIKNKNEKENSVNNFEKSNVKIREARQQLEQMTQEAYESIDKLHKKSIKEDDIQNVDNHYEKLAKELTEQAEREKKEEQQNEHYERLAQELIEQAKREKAAEQKEQTEPAKQVNPIEKNEKVDNNNEIEITYCNLGKNEDMYKLYDCDIKKGLRESRKKSELIDYHDIIKDEKILERVKSNKDLVDMNVIKLLYTYDERYNVDRLNQYLNVLEMTNSKEQKLHELEKNNIFVSYNLRGLYDKIKQPDGTKVDAYTYEERQQILNNANIAKKLGMARVDKGFEVAVKEQFEKIKSKVSRLFNKTRFFTNKPTPGALGSGEGENPGGINQVQTAHKEFTEAIHTEPNPENNKIIHTIESTERQEGDLTAEQIADRLDEYFNR